MSLTFSYHARTPSGERVRGTMRALDRGAALATLRERMLVPTSLETASSTLGLGRFSLGPNPASVSPSSAPTPRSNMPASTFRRRSSCWSRKPGRRVSRTP